MQDGTPKDVTEVRKSIRDLLLDSQDSTTAKVPELSTSQAQQVLAQVSTLLAELDSGQAATEWAKKAAGYKRKVIPYLTEGLLIYISELAATTGTASAESTSTAAGEHSPQGSNSTLLGKSASTSSKKDEKTTAAEATAELPKEPTSTTVTTSVENTGTTDMDINRSKVSDSTLLGENASTSPKLAEKITIEAATADLLGAPSTQISTSSTGSTVVKTTDMDPDQTSSSSPNESKAETSPTVDLSAKILPFASHSPLKRDDTVTLVEREHCASETGECETLSMAEIGEGKEEEEDHDGYQVVDEDSLRTRDLALATSTALPEDQEEKMQLGESRYGAEDSSSSSVGSFESVISDSAYSSEESVSSNYGSGSDDNVKIGSVASLVAKLEQSPTTPMGNTSTPVSGRSLVSNLASEIQKLGRASVKMLDKIETLEEHEVERLEKIATLEKQAVLTATSVREDIRNITERSTMNTDRFVREIRGTTERNTTRTEELGQTLTRHLHLTDLRNRSAINSHEELSNKVEKVAQQVSDSIGQQDALLPLLREMTETAAKREQEHQQQLDQIQEQWRESVKEIHRGQNMLQRATVRRQDELGEQVLDLVHAISALTASVEDMQQDVIHQVHEQLLSQPAARLSRSAARAIEAPGKGQSSLDFHGPGNGKGWHRAKGKGKGGAKGYEQRPSDHRPLVSIPEAEEQEQESIRIKLEAFSRIAHKLRQKAAFQGLCKAVYQQKTDDFDWDGSESGPPTVWIYYGRHGTSHGSASLKKPSPQIPKANKKAQHSDSAVDQIEASPSPASSQDSQVASSAKAAEGGAPEEPSSPSSDNLEESDISDDEDAELQTWRCNRRHFDAKQGAPVKCDRLNLVSHQHCERCKYPRFDEEEEEVILPPPPQAQSNNKGSKRPTKASSKSNKAPLSTVKAAVAKVAKPRPIKAAVAKVAKPKPTARVDVSKFIDDEARDAEGEDEYDTDAAEQLRKEAESSLEEQSDENGTSLVAHLPLPEDHPSNPWMRSIILHKGEQALKVLEAGAKSMAKPKDTKKKQKLQETIAEALAYQEPGLTPTQEAMRDAHVAALAKSPEYELECGRAGGTTPAKLNAFRWKELGTKPVPFLVPASKTSPANSWTPEAMMNFVRDGRVWQAILSPDDLKVTQWHRRVVEMLKESAPKKAKKKKVARKDKIDARIVTHLHSYMSLDVNQSYKNRMVKKQKVHLLPTTPDFHEGFGIEGSMWDQEGLASRMVIGHELDAWGSADDGEATEDSSGPPPLESSDSGDDDSTSHHSSDSGGDKGVSFEDSDDSTAKKAAKKARKKKAARRKSTAKEDELTAEVSASASVAAVT